MSGELPVGWAPATIQEVVDRLEYGYTAKAERRCDGPQFLRITDIENGLIDWTSVPRCEIDQNGLAKYRLKHGDIVFARTGSIDKACMVRNPPEAVFASYLIRGRPIETRTARWLDAFVASFQYRAQAAAASAGIGRANINAKSIGRIGLPLPPLLEQHRIVEAIESYFTRLDDAVATLERVQRNLKRYRASVLKAAVEGRLVPTEAELARTEGRDYEPASFLLDRILTERRRRWEEAELAKMKAKGKVPKDDTWRARYDEPARPATDENAQLPDGWIWASLEALTCSVRVVCYGILMPKDDIPGGIPYVKVRDMRSGKLDVDSLQRTSREIAARYPRSVLKVGDLLLAIRGTYGRVVDVPRALEGGNITQDSARLDFLPGVNRRYAKWMLLAPDTGSFFKRVARGVAVKGVNIADVRVTPVPLPPLAEQERIVEEIEDLLSIEEAHEEMLSASQARLVRLRQSILKWAFEGRLVDQDPTDEPASKLLERIRAERESTNSDPRRNPRRPRARSPKA